VEQVADPVHDASVTGEGPTGRFGLVLGSAGFLPIVLLMALGVTQGFDGAAFGVLAPEIKRTFHLDNAGIDAVTSLTAAVPVMCSIFLGYFGDKGRRIQLTTAGAVLWGIAAIFTGLAPVLAVLIAARLVGGVGLLATQTIYPSLLSDYYPPEGLARIFTVFLIGSTGVGLVGGPLAGWLGSIVGWRPTFVVLAIPTFVCAAAVWLRLKEPPRRSLQANRVGLPPVPGLATAEAFTGSIVEGFRAVRSIRTLRRVWVAAFLFGAGTIPLTTLVSVYFHDVYHVGSTERGGIGALLGLGGLVGIAIGGVVAQRITASNKLSLIPLVSGCFVVEFGILAIVIANLHSLAGSIVVACILAIGAVGYLPSYVTLVALIAPASLRSQAYAWSLFFYALGAICISGFIGVIADARGQRTALASLGVLVIVGALIAMSASRFVDGDLARIGNESGPAPGSESPRVGT
jgi:MFS family permease